MAAECLLCNHCLQDWRGAALYDPLQWVRRGCGSRRRSVARSGGVTSFLWTSLWCGLLVCSISAKQSERHYRQYTWCWVLWEIVSKEKNYHLIHTHRPTAKHINIPIAK